MTDKKYQSLTSSATLTKLVDKMIAMGRPIGFDIESGYTGEESKGLALLTYHPNWILVGVSFTNTLKGAFYIPVAHDRGGNVDDEVVAARAIWKLVNSGLGVAHNASFELNGLSRWFRDTLWDDIVVGPQVRASNGYFDVKSDTMVEAHLLALYEPKGPGGGIGVGLKELSKHVLGHVMTEFKSLFPEEDTEMGPGTKKSKLTTIRFNTRNAENTSIVEYACEDAVSCLALHLIHAPQLATSNIFRVEIELLRVLAEMEYEGMLLDWTYIHEKAEELLIFRDKMNEEILAELSERLQETVNINIASPKQLGDLLFNKLGLPVKMRTDSGAPSTSEKALRSIAQEDPVVKKILRYREVNKLYGSYLHKYDVELNYDGTGRARPNHRSLGALTGRLSVDHVSYQQWPKTYHFELKDGTTFDLNFRDLMIAPEGFRIIGYDWSQVELRVMAGLAQETTLIEAFRKGQDIHKTTASAMMKIPYEKVDKKLRAKGKAQPLYEKVLTPFGWTTMGKIVVGDMVVGSDGSPVRVQGVFPQGKKKIYKVTLSDGATVDMCDEHLLTVRNRNTKGAKWITKTLGELMKSGLRQESAGGKYAQPKYELPARPVIEYANPGKLPIDPYFLGLLLGDGGFRHQSAAYYCTIDEELANYVRDYAPKIGVKIRETVREDGLIQFHFFSGEKNGKNPLNKALRDLGLWGVMGSDKFIPEIYKRASPEDRLATLQGVMDTDGSPQYSGAYLRLSAERLLKDVQEIARSLGGNATYSTKPAGAGYGKVRKDVHITQVLLQNGLVPFRLTRKIGKLKSRKYKNAVRIFDAEYVGDFEAQCISVENEDGLYISNDYSVIHNTLNFATAYQSGAANIAEMLDSPTDPVTREDAEIMLRQYYEGYPKLRGWMDRMQSNGKESGFVMTPFGRKYTVWQFQQMSQKKNHDKANMLESEGKRLCVNAVVQGGAADLLKFSMVEVSKIIKENNLQDKIKLVCTVHDALEFYVHESISTQEVIDLFKDAVSPKIPGFPEILAEWHEGKTWGSVVELNLDDNKVITSYSLEDVDQEFSTIEEAYEYQDNPPIVDSIREEKTVENPDEEPKRVVITTTYEGLPAREQMLKFRDYLVANEGPHDVRLDTSLGENKLKWKVSLRSLDKTEISVILGGAKVEILEAEKELVFEEEPPF